MRIIFLTAALLASSSSWADTLTLETTIITEWKAVYGQIEAKETVPARARIGGLVVELAITEGDTVSAGQKVALIRDDKIVFQIAALDAQIEAFQAQLENASSELDRGQALVERGVATVQRLDQLRTSVDVLNGQISTTMAQREVILQQSAEGEVLAPGDGLVLTVPVTLGAVVLAGEPVASIGGGGFFLRLAIPERHALALQEGAEIKITTVGIQATGKIAKIYPQIENGRVIADVDVEGLDEGFVNARVLVELPVGERTALLIPTAAVTTRSGIDFVTVNADDEAIQRSVVLGEALIRDGVDYIEVLTGLTVGDRVVTP